ncbi:MAG TPA: bifunctional phosphoribosyl-AMP cyclohydrolase/phosphoribosyl-ATP diphosphatase HisIE [Candidatus Limnocylindria bacterium]|nr:bifunctional phosphoribosyl-AMP cyclohydrolase/phosphoribosyl-ATP diphosphatase HisIE [Candidatus Limnocylindria bacterium]
MAGLSVEAGRQPDFDKGLLPVVVQSAVDGEVLMLAWANAEALEATLSTAEAHFWSRSRDELWRKGATSGNVLHVSSVRLDCDGDALLYRVHETGPACHTGRRACFEAGGDAPARLSLAALEGIVADRSGASVDESYTARLLSDGPRKPAAKVVEEAGEAAVAALAESQDRLAEEAADLLYHLLVLLHARDVPLADVEACLGERHRR